MSSQREAVFLDRDGVLNRTFVRDGVSYPPENMAQLELLPGVADSLHALDQAGLYLIVVTNQPDVARGRQTRERIEEMHQFLMDRLPLREIATCYHDTADNCDCRKPKPGLILETARRWQVDPKGSFLVGDRWSDVAAGAAAGCKTFLVNTPYSQPHKCHFDYTVADLPEAAAIILELLQNPRKV